MSKDPGAYLICEKRRTQKSFRYEDTCTSRADFSWPIVIFYGYLCTQEGLQQQHTHVFQTLQVSKLPKIWKWTSNDLEVFVHFQILEDENLESLVFQTLQFFYEV